MTAPSPTQPQRLHTIGLTGGIGSGKSTVARHLAHLGAWVVDTDAIARALTLPGGLGIAPIRDAFGPAFLDAHGALDRAAMRTLVFADPSARQRLEGILHPLIGQQTEAAAAQAAPGQPVVFDVPLLVESGPRWRQRVQQVWVVDCQEATQVRRVMQRSGWTAEEVQRVIDQQARRAQRLAVADAVIDNDEATLDALHAQVTALWQRWCAPHT